MTRNRSNSNHNIAMKGSLFSFPPAKLLVVYVVVLCAIGIQQQTARMVAATTPTALSFSTIEKEVDNYFEELSITEFARSYLLPPLSSSSPLLDSTSNSHPDVENLFRRVLSQQGMNTEPALPTYDEVEIDTKRSGIGSQFLNNHLSQAGVFDGSTGGTTITTAASSTSNNRPRNQGVRGKNGGFQQAIAAPQLYKDQIDANMYGAIPQAFYNGGRTGTGGTDDDFFTTDDHSPNSGTSGGGGTIGKMKKGGGVDFDWYEYNSKGYDDDSVYDYGLKHKRIKKDKRYKEPKKKIDQKLTKSGKKHSKSFGYDPYKHDDDDTFNSADDDWSFTNWEWEWVEDEGYTEQSQQYHNQNMNYNVDLASPFRADRSSRNANNNNNSNDDTGGGLGSSMRGWTMTSRMDEEPTSRIGSFGSRVETLGEDADAEVTEADDNDDDDYAYYYDTESDWERDPNIVTDGYELGENGFVAGGQEHYIQVGGGATVIQTQPNPNTGNYRFNFPTIQHQVFSGGVLLKVHSSIDVSTMDPEIFAVLQSVLTPYLQKTMGPTLRAYTMEIDYSPGDHDKYTFITTARTKDVVITNMVVSCTFKVVSDSIDSFKLINHQQASQWIHNFFKGPEIYKFMESLRANNIPVNDVAFIDQQLQVSTPATAESITEANSYTPSASSSSSTISQSGNNQNGGIIVGITLSVLLVGIFFFLHYTARLPSRAQIGSFTLETRDKVREYITRIKNERDEAKKLNTNTKGDGGFENEFEGGRRRRTFSGTFRRFPTGGLQKAAIQKKPATSEQFLNTEETASKASSSSSSSSSSKKSGSRNSHRNNRDGSSKILNKKSFDTATVDDYSFSNVEGDYGPMTPSHSRRSGAVQQMITPSRRTMNSTTTGDGGGDDFSLLDAYDSAHHVDRTTSSNIIDRVSNGISQAAYLMSPGNYDRGNNSPQGNQSLKSPIPSSAPRRVTASDIASPNDVDNWSIDESCHTKTPSDHPLYREWNHYTTGVDAPSSNSPPNNDAVTSSDYWEGMAQQYQARTTQGRKLHVPRFT